MSYPMYLIQTLGAPRNHHALFIKTNETTDAGQIINVIGNIQEGMAFEIRFTDASPSIETNYVGASFLGWTSSSDLSRMEEVCRSNPAPAKQFDGPKRIDPKMPLRRCQEWTAETIELLEKRTLLKRDGETGPPLSKGASSSKGPLLEP